MGSKQQPKTQPGPAKPSRPTTTRTIREGEQGPPTRDTPLREPGR
jgi:hypothetical protein